MSRKVCVTLLRASVLGPHGVAHVLIYPCGKAQKNPLFPSRFIVADRSSLSRVRFAASRPWTAPVRSERRAAYEGKGGERGAWELRGRASA